MGEEGDEDDIEDNRAPDHQDFIDIVSRGRLTKTSLSIFRTFHI